MAQNVSYNDIVQSKASINRYVSLANKRIQRLENAGLKDSPAYQKLLGNGGAKFSVKGKSHNQLQQEISRLTSFVNSETSTIRGINNNLKEIAKNTGVKFSSLKDLRNQSKSFFTLASKVEQYLRTVEDMASAIGYQKIWEAINSYVKNGETSISEAEKDVDSIIKIVDNLLNAPNKVPSNITEDGWWNIGASSGWQVKLK